MERWTFPPIVFPAGCTGSAWSARSAGSRPEHGPVRRPDRRGPASRAAPCFRSRRTVREGSRRNHHPMVSGSGARVRGEAGEASP